MLFKTSDECDLELISYTATPIPATGEMHARLATDDMMPVRAARASFGKQDKTGDNPKADVKLMNFLAEHGHLTPFEYQHATFLIECPLFIRSQIHRHRTFSYNEISRRYTEENLAFWVPDAWRKQSTNNKQASEEGELAVSNEDCNAAMRLVVESSLEQYNYLLEVGAAREQARAVLPQSLLTNFYMGGNLRNWAHFIELRRDPHAQLEVQVIANKIAEKLRQLWPASCEALGI